MPGYKKKGEKENKAQQRRNKKEKRSTNMGEDTDDFNQLNNQLLSLGLVLKQIPGDGNCLFRALGDQLEGNPHQHLRHREDVVQYMLNHRPDFEPFVEDDISFGEHIRNLSEPGTFGGNDSIVAFARLHNLTVVLHQLNSPLWQVHGGVNASPGIREAHISYHNGDHYNSVRRCGDLNSSGPANVRLSSICTPATAAASTNQYANKQTHSTNSSDISGEESDYENSPSSRNLHKLVDQVLLRVQSRVTDESEIMTALENNAYNVQDTVSELVYGKYGRSSVNPNRYGPVRDPTPGIWSEHGSATRIIGGQSDDYSSKPTRNNNMSAKRQKELKKRQQRLEKDLTKSSPARGASREPAGLARGAGRAPSREPDSFMPNIKTLTI